MQHLLERGPIALGGNKGQAVCASLPCGRASREHRQPEEPGDGRLRQWQRQSQVPRLQRRQSDKSARSGGRGANQTQESQFAADFQQGATAVFLPAGTYVVVKNTRYIYIYMLYIY